MPFIKHISKADKYQGESFTKTLGRGDGSVWASNEKVNWQLFDPNGGAVGTLTDAILSGDDLTYTVKIPKTTTTAFDGVYLLLVYVIDTGDADINDVIAEYRLNFMTTVPV